MRKRWPTRRLKLNMMWLPAVAIVATLLSSAQSHGQPEYSTATGPYPGPPLWRVSKGDHDLWLFGTLSAVPKEMKWSSPAVERAIGDAQEVLLPPGVAARRLKPAHLIRIWRRMRELNSNPSGKPLAEVLPPDLYRRYSVLRDRYVRRERNLEAERPIVAATRVYQDAIADMGLTSGQDVQRGIERLARRAGVETTETQLKVDPEVLLDHAARVSADAEIDCFGRVMSTIEAGETRIAARARAWALGDVAALRRFDYPGIQRDCLSHSGWPHAFRETLQEANDKWLEAAERALSANRTTFGTLDVRDLVSADGLLARLIERGYDVRAP